ncbi:MAG: cobalamin B12-binding domain-containing protein, partial [Verrucomicrobiales bacterium]|nr:cobalamin B12-binding domain-containing protein [Verrucomicrobiales bacterium]
MPDILLSTLNAKFIHASFGLRYLRANLGELRDRAEILEFEIKQTPLEIVEAILARNPRIVGLGVYIWNVRPTLEVVALLKRLRPELPVVLGGPEVSYETEHQEIVALADHTITGEADLVFPDLCRALLDPRPGTPPPPRLIHAPIPDLARVRLPYDLYDDHDIAHRVLYIEASRGCPFTCEFCLSSLEIPVRAFPL